MDKLMLKELGSIQLHQAKQKFIGQIALGEENRIGLIISMAKSLLDYGKVDSLEEVFLKINEVTGAQILKISNEMFDKDQLSTLLFEPAD